MRTEATLNPAEKIKLAALKDLTTKHNQTYPGQFINFQALFGKAEDMPDLNRLVRKAISDGVARAKAPAPTLSKKAETELVAKELTPTTPVIVAPAKKPVTPKPTKEVITMGSASYVAPPAIDPYVGLSANAKVHALALRTHGVGTIMSGPLTKDTSLTQSDLDQLRNWVEAQKTTGGQQKWVTNVGWGSGAYSTRWQFKVTGFGTTSTSTSAPTWHLWINNGLT
jgi:hypothetical protein